jgi:hypothetical protein
MSWRRWIGAVTVLALGGVFYCAFTSDSPASVKAGDAGAPASSVQLFAGTASCSGRGCHGGLEARPEQPIGQNEYSLWISHDQHAEAFRVLFTKRSQDIARNLNIKEAHEDGRCLSCHLTPFAAVGEDVPSPASVLGKRINEEKVFGVGCESCHGAADRWLSAHTESVWRDYRPEQKAKLGMVPVDDIVELAQACAGCHVGAPPSKQVPLARDVNHDLIAAGHPRLNFELGVYLANLPPHWNEEARAQKREKGMHEARTWTLGQLASAQAALDLLAYRAEDPSRPWPEFAEYDCFACHHDLQGKSWRQKSGYGASRPRGSLPWGIWYFTMPRLMADASADSDLRKALDRLERTISRPAPSRSEVIKQARLAREALQKLRITDRDGRGKPPLEKWLAAFGTDKHSAVDPSWDAATQLYLAAGALEPSLQREKTFQDLTTELAFPPGLGSPRHFEPERIGKLLKQLRR